MIVMRWSSDMEDPYTHPILYKIRNKKRKWLVSIWGKDTENTYSEEILFNESLNISKEYAYNKLKEYSDMGCFSYGFIVRLLR